MALGRIISNRKKSVLQRKAWRKHRIRKAERVRLQGGHKQGDILDPELVTVDILKKRRTSPRANITLSGKKKRKLLKRLKHSKSEKTVEDVEMKAEISKKRQTKKSKAKEIDMETEAAVDSNDGINSENKD